MRIDEMPAGRECDALIYKALGNEVEHCCFVDDSYGASCVGSENAIDCLIAEQKAKKDKEIPGDCEYWKTIDIPPYSADIAAAWEVLLKLKEKGFTWMMGETDYKKDYIVVELGLEIITRNNHNSIAETAPLAICRAALKAMGVGEI